MTQTTKPSKEAVRAYFQRRTDALLAEPPEPPPSAEEIRRQLGWHLLPQDRQPDHEDRD